MNYSFSVQGQEHFWYIDSGWSGVWLVLSSIVLKDGPIVTFRDNNEEAVKGLVQYGANQSNWKMFSISRAFKTIWFQSVNCVKLATKFYLTAMKEKSWTQGMQLWSLHLGTITFTYYDSIYVSQYWFILSLHYFLISLSSKHKLLIFALLL